jgi:hypothetical protein
MRLRCYCVTVMDNWTPLRYFWTLRSAEKFWKKHLQCATLYWWEGKYWVYRKGFHDYGDKVPWVTTQVKAYD